MNMKKSTSSMEFECLFLKDCRDYIHKSKSNIFKVQDLLSEESNNGVKDNCNYIRLFESRLIDQNSRMKNISFQL
ncbi:hypothetical protein TVAG_202070 [Trichomonas vaginalis G3]|uniref:Uncharacterized protein n=1 Tax=Trichomonas vaginalis (strain ATCC PRA-98 / G3) TaxID=412133 RepID=A2DWM8_TRIV3|nr:hypothetical protein TVAGG3_0201700 [Trichomonas vaginalis G3]EAY15213.1 hypothetical protein TVAG_202070 [Trichomonas vaginalis G3]KAI5550633.1 hypothetical protein TVAGG3_0201700 [Trichomonas vaginalis G3]|eukprot:XP_001327436.1 hypothetical protein [Trichomonas vaginalis G3]